MSEKIQHNFHDTTGYPKAMNPETSEITLKLNGSLQICISELTGAIKESDELYEKYQKDINECMN